MNLGEGYSSIIQVQSSLPRAMKKERKTMKAYHTALLGDILKRVGHYVSSLKRSPKLDTPFW